MTLIYQNLFQCTNNNSSATPYNSVFRNHLFSIELSIQSNIRFIVHLFCVAIMVDCHVYLFILRTQYSAILDEDIQIALPFDYYYNQPFELSHCYVFCIYILCVCVFSLSLLPFTLFRPLAISLALLVFDIHLHRFSIIPLLNMYLKFTWQRFA